MSRHHSPQQESVAVATAQSRTSAHKLIVALLCATALSLLLALATAAVANAGVPNASYSIADTNLVASPDGGFDYTVWLRDSSNMPIANATIVLDFTTAPGIVLCPSQDTDRDGKLLLVSDELGHAVFHVRAGGSSNGVVTIGTTLDAFAHAHPRTTDFDGDSDVDGADQAALDALMGTTGPAGDLDANGTVDAADVAIETAHVGGSCVAAPALKTTWGALKAIFR